MVKLPLPNLLWWRWRRRAQPGPLPLALAPPAPPGWDRPLGGALYAFFTAPRRIFRSTYRAVRHKLGWGPQPPQSAFELWAAQRAAAGLVTPLAAAYGMDADAGAVAALAPAEPASAASSEPATPTKPASEGGSSDVHVIHTPASVPALPFSRVVAQAQRQLLGDADSVHNADSVDMSIDSISSHPVTAAGSEEPLAAALPESAVAGHSCGGRSPSAHPVVRVVLGVALALLPFAAASTMNHAGAASRSRHQCCSKHGQEQSPFPARRQVFERPRRVPWRAPKPWAFLAEE